MHYYVATGSARGLSPFNKPLSALEALAFLDCSRTSDITLHVYDDKWARVSEEQLHAALEELDWVRGLRGG